MRSWMCTVAAEEHRRDIEAGTDAPENLEDMSLDELLDALVAAVRGYGARSADENIARETALLEYITENF